MENWERFLPLSPEQLARELSLEELGELKLILEAKLSQAQPPPTAVFSSPIKHLSDLYSLDALVDQGTYGYIWRATELASKRVFALKQVKQRQHSRDVGFPIHALREIDALSCLKSHANIVYLHQVVQHANAGRVDIFLVLEYLPVNMHTLLRGGIEFTLTQCQSILRQLLSALSFLHANNFMHRDLKWENVLVDLNEGRIALADFGMCRRQNAGRRYTFVVVTLHYRAPELLLLQDSYLGHAVDMWSMGCLFYELMTGGQVLFPGRTELEQLNLIWHILGTPITASEGSADNARYWPEFAHILNKLGVDLAEQNTCRLVFGAGASADGLLRAMLCLNPRHRITAQDALSHAWFNDV